MTVISTVQMPTVLNTVEKRIILGVSIGMKKYEKVGKIRNEDFNKFLNESEMGMSRTVKNKLVRERKKINESELHREALLWDEYEGEIL